MRRFRINVDDAAVYWLLNRGAWGVYLVFALVFDCSCESADVFNDYCMQCYMKDCAKSKYY